MNRSELTEILVRFRDEDYNPRIVDWEAWLKSLDDETFNTFARGYLLGISVKLKRYEQLLGMKFMCQHPTNERLRRTRNQG
jgi:hypothetical protein